MDTDLTILPTKYLDELRKSGEDELNSTHANIHVSNADRQSTISLFIASQGVLGSYTNLNDMKYNDLFIKVLTHCLNPNINEFIKYAQDEIKYSFEADMSNFEDDGM